MMITPQVKASGNANGVERLTLYLKRRNKKEMNYDEIGIDTSVSVPDSWFDRCSNNGYERYIDKNGDRRYCDNNEPVGDNPFRPCAKCGGMPNEYGDDHCIERLGNVMNACCGHGNRMGYIQFDSGHLIEGYFTVKIKQPNGEYL